MTDEVEAAAELPPVSCNVAGSVGWVVDFGAVDVTTTEDVGCEDEDKSSSPAFSN